MFDGGPAQRAGLSAGDVIFAWNNLKVGAGNLHSQIERAPAGATARAHAFRRDELMTFDITLAPAPLDTCWLTVRGDAPAEAVARREGWLRGPARAEAS